MLASMVDGVSSDEPESDCQSDLELEEYRNRIKYRNPGDTIVESTMERWDLFNLKSILAATTFLSKIENKYDSDEDLNREDGQHDIDVDISEETAAKIVTIRKAVDISEETAAKIVTIISNSVLGLVRNLNDLTVDNYIQFIERYFPIDEADWTELKGKIRTSASKGPKIYLKAIKGEINKKDDLKLVAFIKHNLSGDSVSREIHGTITSLPDENVFQLEDHLQLPSLEDCVLRIEVRKVKTGETVKSRSLVGYTEIPLETIPSSIENYYHFNKESRLSFPTKSESFGHILLNMKKDLTEEFPSTTVPKILETYLLDRLNKVLNKDLHLSQSIDPVSPPVSYFVSATHNFVNSQSNYQPYMQLITKDRSEVDQSGKIRLTSIVEDEIELGLNHKRSPNQSPSFLSTPPTSSPALSPSQSLISLDRRSRSPHRIVENIRDSLGSLSLSNRKKHKPNRFGISKLLSSLSQHKILHETLPDQTDVSWDLQLSVSSEVLFSIQELEDIYEHFILNTIAEHTLEKFDGKLSNTDDSILRILTGFVEANCQEVEQMKAHSFISSYNKVPFDNAVISKHIKTFSKSQNKTETVNQLAKTILSMFEKHADLHDENLPFVMESLKVLKENNILDVQQITESVENRVSKTFNNSMKSMKTETKIEFCRNFLNSFVTKEMKKEENMTYQELFDGILDFHLVTGDKYLSLCEHLVKNHLPSTVRIPMKYTEEDSRVKELLLVLDTFYSLRRIWKVVHPTEDTPKWIFSLYQKYPEAWINLAIIKAEKRFQDLKSYVQQNVDDFQATRNQGTLSRSLSQEEEDDMMNQTLFLIFEIIESCWKFREDLVWPEPEINLRTGIKLLKDMTLFETSIMNLVEDIHWRDQQYDAHELDICLKLIAGILKRHEKTIQEISKLHHEIAEEEGKADVCSYKKQMDSCFEEIEKIRNTWKVRMTTEIQSFADERRKRMTDLINAKQLVNNDDDENETLMKYLDDECGKIYKKIKNKCRRSQIILALWKVMEEQMQVKFEYKKDRNDARNKPSRFNLLKKSLEVMVVEKTKMNDNGVIDDLELDRLHKMLREVNVLSEDTDILISKVLRKKAESTVVDFDDKNCKLDNGCIKLNLKLAFTPETQEVILKLVHVMQVPSREEGKQTNIQLTARLISDSQSSKPKAQSSEVFKDINTSYVFALQTEAPPVFQFSLDQMAAKKEFADAFLVINIFHVNRGKAKLCLGESVIQLKKNGHLLLELEQIKSAGDIEDVPSLTYWMADLDDVYLTEEYEELAKRTESAAKKIVDRDREYRKKKFSYSK